MRFWSLVSFRRKETFVAFFRSCEKANLIIQVLSRLKQKYWKVHEATCAKWKSRISVHKKKCAKFGFCFSGGKNIAIISFDLVSLLKNEFKSVFFLWTRSLIKKAKFISVCGLFKNKVDWSVNNKLSWIKLEMSLKFWRFFFSTLRALTTFCFFVQCTQLCFSTQNWNAKVLLKRNNPFST